MAEEQVAYVHSANTAYVYEDEICSDNTESFIIYVAHLRTSEILVLEQSSAVIWDVLKTPQTLDDVVFAIAELFEMNTEEVRSATVDFVYHMFNRGYLSDVVSSDV